MIDEARFTAIAGNGGDGKVSFRREKYVPRGGPDGGNGGDGGSIYVRTDPNVNTLLYFSGKPEIQADHGQPGGKTKKHGKNAADVTINIPVGTVIHDASTDEVLADLDQPHKTFCLVRGGKGGRGNTEFKSATHQTPTEAEAGTPGDTRDIRLTLRILAQVGLTGFPNAGKSTLLSVLTNANPKIANYPFTTLYPNLGVLQGQNDRSLIIADIPGLIEGASTEKGLGTRFLKHIERCEVLVYVLYPEDHALDTRAEDLAQGLLDQKRKLIHELKEFNASLLAIPAITVVNKVDLLTDEQLNVVLDAFKDKNETILPISAATGEQLEEFTHLLFTAYRKRKKD